MITAGIDIGSITAKAALFNNDHILGSRVIFTGYNAKKAGRTVLDETLAALNMAASDIHTIVSTGYGRNTVDFADKAITEITCHGAGAHFIDPEVRTIIDVGGQDSKVVRINEAGKVVDFAMNDKCAAGTGRFLEVMARAMEVDLDEFGDIFLTSQNPAKISSICTVFAESEVVGLLADGRDIPAIAACLCDAVARRVIAMANRLSVEDPVLLCGGVAHNIGVREALQRHLDREVVVPDRPQLVGAVGAAVLAGERASR